MEDEPDYTLRCDACGTAIDQDDPDQFHEPSGMYNCPSCGHDNGADEGGYA
jgi:rRNA maturation protein Nop10